VPHASGCWEIKKLAEQFHKKMHQQPCQDGAPSHQWEGKQKMEFQDAKRALKAIYGNFEPSDNERRKAHHVIFGGSWEITSHRIVKTLR
jgi:hypothetical protein